MTVLCVVARWAREGVSICWHRDGDGWWTVGVELSLRPFFTCRRGGGYFVGRSSTL